MAEEKDKRSMEEVEEENRRMREELRARPLRREENDDGSGKKGGGFNLWTLVLTVALSVIIVVIGAQMGYIGGVEQDFVDYVNNNFALKSDIQEVPDLTQYAKQSDLPNMDDYAKSEDIPEVIAGEQGAQGVGISSATIDSSGHLVLTLTNGSTVDAGYVGGGTSGGGSVTTGDISVAIDAVETTFITTITPSNQVFPVKIVNGTGYYQQVKFGLIMQCITTSPDNTAENTVITSALVNTGTPHTINFVPSAALCQLVYFTWTGMDFILVPPNSEYNVYVYLNGISTIYAEIWQISITGVVATQL